MSRRVVRVLGLVAALLSVAFNGPCPPQPPPNGSWNKDQTFEGFRMESVSYVGANDYWIAGERYQVVNSVITQSAVLYHYHILNGRVVLESPTLACTQGGALESIYFLNPQLGWAVGSVSYRTDDGGLTWKYLGNRCPSCQGNCPAQTHQVYFVDKRQGFAATDGGVDLTNSAGDKWTYSGCGGKGRILGVHVLPVSQDGHQYGWAVGEKGMICVTSNGGADWSPQTSPGLNEDLRGVFFLDKDRGFIVGGNGLVRDLQVVQDTPPPGWPVAPPPAPPYVAINDGCMAHDGFFFWNENTQNYGWFHVPYRCCLECCEADRFGATCSQRQVPPSPSQIILRTYDSGATWTVIKDQQNENPLNRIVFKDDLHGWAVGGTEYWASSRPDAATLPSGVILATDDGGKTWHEQTGSPVPWTTPVYDISFLDLNNGVAVGNSTGFGWKAVNPPSFPDTPYACQQHPGQTTADCGYGEYRTINPLGSFTWKTDKGGKP